MTTTIPTAETWADVQERLDAAAAEDYAAVQRELEAAEAEHRRLTEQALMGALGAVGPLDLQRVESRKQLAELQLQGLPEKHRRAANEASRTHVAAVRAHAEELMARHGKAGGRLTKARDGLVKALRAVHEVVEDFNADVTALLAEARPAFTVTERQDAIVEMRYVRDDMTDQVHEVPHVKRPSGPNISRPVTDVVDGVRVQWAGVRNNAGGTPRAVVVDDVLLEPLTLDQVLVEDLDEGVPDEVRRAVRAVADAQPARGRSRR